MVNASGDYETEQQRLRQQEGLEDETDLEINPEDFQVPEVNPEIYKDVDPILFRGFLTVAATINGVPFVFKSLNHHEFEWLALTQQLHTRDVAAVQRYYSMFLAYGVALVDGVNVLKARDERLHELAEFFGSLPKEAQQKVVRHLSEINRRANRAVLLVEPYMLENRSRMRWVQVKGLDLSATAITGFEGTQSLGLNWGQLSWRALNNLEDLRENAEREWENAKFVASSMAGKGMQRIYNADKRRRQEARTEQIERREKILRFALLNEPMDEQKQTGTVLVARSVAELTKQLERDLTGEKDWHDRVIEDHENRVRANLDQRAQAINEARAAHIREFGDRPIIAGTDMSGLSRSEVQKRIAERRVEIARSLAAQAAHPEYSDPKYDEFSQKWLQQPIVRNSPSVMPAKARPRSTGTPFRRG
jgi:hypothetical protein